MPVGIVVQRTTMQRSQSQNVTDLQPARGITERTRLTAIEVKIEKIIFVRQAGQRIRAGHAISTPQHQVLPRLVAQRTLRLQAQAQHLAPQPIQTTYPSRHTIALRIKYRHLQVIHNFALASQAPALLAFIRTQGIGQGINRLPLKAAHQTGMATAGTATVGHRAAASVERIEQVAARRHRPTALAHTEFRHRSSPAHKHHGQPPL
ncbi:hypothetical protein D3C77_503410 [compost metagenome]